MSSDNKPVEDKKKLASLEGDKDTARVLAKAKKMIAMAEDQTMEIKELLSEASVSRDLITNLVSDPSRHSIDEWNIVSRAVNLCEARLAKAKGKSIKELKKEREQTEGVKATKKRKGKTRGRRKGWLQM